MLYPMRSIRSSIAAKIIVLLLISLSFVMAINAVVSHFLHQHVLPGVFLQSLVMIVFTTAVLYLGLSRILISRLRSIVSSVDAYAAGDLSSRIADASRDEIGLLAQTLNRMVTGSQENSARLQAAVEEARHLKGVLEDLMVRSERMAMINGLSAGFAHEINNPLGAIMQHAQNIERRISPDLPANLETAREAGIDLDGLRDYLDKRGVPGFVAPIREAGARASKIVTSMVRYSRTREIIRETADLAAVINQTLELATNDYDLKKRYDFRRIEVVRDFDPALPQVVMTVIDIEQVLFNIIKNAAQAMEASSLIRKPRITLRTRQEQGSVLVEIEDNGPGMEEVVQRRIFEPFFTTREDAVGSGLGLPVSRSIITRGHHGNIAVRSQPGEGTCISISLPLDGDVV
jgi:signal transduction histidine kinase